MKSVITTHILDTHRGRPAVDVNVVLFQWHAVDGEWVEIAQAKTNEDGRITDWLGSRKREAGLYRVEFDTAGYFEQQELATLYPKVDIHFQIDAPDEHYHIPLLLSANGYSTYRGS